MKKNRAVFLDRDGTLILETDYLSSLKQIKFFKNSANAVKLLKERGFKIIVVTNQSGVARGYFTEAFVKKAHRHIKKVLDEQGAKIDAFYYCPHLKYAPVKKYRKSCTCRKPNTGMVMAAKKKYNLDLKNSFSIGDKLADVKLGHNSKMWTILVKTGYGDEEKKLIRDKNEKPDFFADDIYDAAKWIIKKAK